MNTKQPQANEADHSAAAKGVTRFRKLLSIAGALALLLVITGMTVRLVFRDQYLWSGLICYVTSPASMVLLLFLSAACLKKQSRLQRRVAIGLLFVAVCWTVNAQWVSNSGLPKQAEHSAPNRIMFWIVCEGKLGWERVFDTITEQNPDVIALAEADQLKIRGADFFSTHFSGYHRIDLPRRLLLLSRLPIVSQRRLRWVKGAVHESVVLQSQHGPVTLVFSDVASTISMHRKLPIESLVEAATTLEGPVIAVGDLNTPVDSLFFDKFRSRFKNAFEATGNGLHTTWPMPLPVIAIDHMWGNENVTFHNAKILWTLASDHRPLVANFSIPQKPE